MKLSRFFGNTDVPVPTEVYGVPAAAWDFEVSHSQRMGGAILMGVYGSEMQQRDDLVKRALANELTAKEMDDLEALRPIGTKERAARFIAGPHHGNPLFD